MLFMDPLKVSRGSIEYLWLTLMLFGGSNYYKLVIVGGLLIRLRGFNRFSKYSFVSNNKCCHLDLKQQYYAINNGRADILK